MSKELIRNERLIAWRKSKGWSQTKLAAKLGLQQGSLSDIERGKGALCEARIRQLIALGFDAGKYFTGIHSFERAYAGVPLPNDFKENSIEILGKAI